MNAWEEGDEVVLVANKWKSFDMWFKFDIEGQAKYSVTLTQWRMNLKTGTITEHLLSDVFGDFPRVNDEYLGRHSQFGYYSVMLNPSRWSLGGVMKYDLHHRQPLATIDFGMDSGEAVFVPRLHPKSEDDGYLITFLHDTPSNQSFFGIYDALTASSTPIAKVALPQRVPFGFHGLWLSEEQFQRGVRRS